MDQLLTFGNPAYWRTPSTIVNGLPSTNPKYVFKIVSQVVCIVANDVETTSMYH